MSKNWRIILIVLGILAFLGFAGFLIFFYKKTEEKTSGTGGNVGTGNEEAGTGGTGGGGCAKYTQSEIEAIISQCTLQKAKALPIPPNHPNFSQFLMQIASDCTNKSPKAGDCK